MANTITVKPLRTFAMGDELKTRRSKPFGVASDVAFQLREAGLVEYGDDKPKKADHQPKPVEKQASENPDAADAHVRRKPKAD